MFYNGRPSRRKARADRRFSHFSGTILVALILSAAVSSPASAAQAAEEPIRIGGTGGALGVMKILADKFEQKHRGAAFTVYPSLGSSGGIKALLAGALDIAVSARKLSDREQGPVIHEFGRSPFVFAVPETSAVSSISVREVVDIYSGKTVTWTDGTPIRLILRPSSEYDTGLLKHISSEMDGAVRAALSRPGMIVETTDQDSARANEKIAGALGTITLGQVLAEKRVLKLLIMNGVAPSVKALADGTYPYFKSYYLIVKPDAPSQVARFIDFVYSPEGRQILSRTGFVALPR